MTSLIDEVTASVDPVALIRRVVEQTCVLIPRADGASVCLLDHNDCLVVLSTRGVLDPQLGRVVPAGRTFSAESLRSGRPEVCHDVLDDRRLTPEVRTVGTRLGVRSSLTVPLFHGRSAIGVISVAARAPGAFDDDDVARIASLTEVISMLISANSELARLVRELFDGAPEHQETSPATRFLASLLVPELAERDRIRADVDALARPGRLRAVFQPVIDLADGQVRGLEGLCRFHDDLGPEHWFAAAHRVGRGVALELLALGTVLDAALDLPPELPVGVNLSPIAALNPAAQGMLVSADRALVVELTEHEPAPEPLSAGMEPLRRHGIRLAVDDAGAGFAGLTQILRLRPDMLKLDRELTAGIETDPARRALASALVQFAAELGAVTVAEGVEREEQYRVLRDLGISYGQGYWLGRPRPAAELVAAL